MYEFIYLLQTRESIRNNETVYKVGRTSQDELKRFNEYPKGSLLHVHLSCCNSVVVERNILEQFNRHFENVHLYGKEYFDGDLLRMMSIVCREASLSFQCSNASQDFCHKMQCVVNEKNTMQEEANQLKQHNRALQLQVHQLTRRAADDVNSHVTQQENDRQVAEANAQQENVRKEGTIDEESGGENVSENIKKTRFKCSKCNKYFSSKQVLTSHIQKCDGLDPKQCKICLKVFTSRYGKYQHTKNVQCSPPPPSPPPASLCADRSNAVLYNLTCR